MLALMIVVGILLSRGVDARFIMAAGLLTLAAANYWMSQLNLSISPWQVVWPRVVLIVGLSMVFVPLNVAAFLYIPRELRGAAVGLWPCCATKAAAWARRLAKPCWNAASSSTPCG